MVGLVLGLVLYRFSETVVDPDLSGHLKFGQLVWETGKVAMPDPFSYVTAGRIWVNHEWLAEVIWYLAFAVAGAVGLIGLKVSLGLLVHGLVYQHLRRQDVSRLRASLIVLAMMHFFLITLITVRPLSVTYPLFLVVLLLIYEMAEGRTRWLWTAPFLFMLWANLHPGFLAGLAVLGTWAAVEVFRRRIGDRRAREKPALPDLAILGVFALSVLATAANPYGVSLWGFLHRTATVPRPDITEWQPIVLMTRYGFSYFVLMALGIGGVFYSRRPRSPALLAVLVSSALLPFVAIRHTPLGALAIAVLAGEHMADAWERWSARRETDHGPGAARGSEEASAVPPWPAPRCSSSFPCRTSPTSV